MSKLKITAATIALAESKVQAWVKRQDCFGEDLLKRLNQYLEFIQIENEDNALEMFFIVIAIYQIDNTGPWLKVQQKSRYKDIAEKCLKYCRVQATTSQHSYLYAELYRHLAVDKLIQSRPWESIATLMAGNYLGRDSEQLEASTSLLGVFQSLQVGHLAQAKENLHTINMKSQNGEKDRADSLRLLIRLHRLSHDKDVLDNIFQIFEFEKLPDNFSAHEIDLEKHLCSLQQGGNPLKLAKFIKQHARDLQKFDIQIALLWLYASKYKFSTFELPKKIRQSGLGNRDFWLTASSFAEDILDCLEFLYQTNISIHIRLERLGKTLSILTQGHDPELTLLFIGAALRWLNRSKQFKFASIILEEYRLHSLRYSEGTTEDSLNIIKDIRESVTFSGVEEAS
ncbi:MAG: hypothetical protein NTX25_05010 [Proteobacteria bacterium]|nr:hypothetical protein [Pseudomonadota bacterium]